jgi:hypothetical protein
MNRASIRTRPHRRFCPQRSYELYSASWVNFNDHQGVISFGTIDQAVEWLAPVVSIVIHECLPIEK